MRIQLLKSKIHRARITDVDLFYEGSLQVDLDLLDRAGLYPYEKILVVNMNNGARLETYAIPGERGTRRFMLNGAAARMGMVGDRITVMSFALLDESEIPGFSPRVVILNENNEVVSEHR
jgi:aspartate 1-decarboxylase